MDKGSCTSFAQFFLFFPKKDKHVLSVGLTTPSGVGRRRGRSGEAAVAVMTASRFMQEDTSVAGREGGLGKNVSVGCCSGGRKRQRATAGRGRCPSPGLEGGGAGAECGLSLRRNIPSRNSSHPPPSHPSSSPLSCPLGGLESGQVFRPKRPHDITSTATDGL